MDGTAEIFVWDGVKDEKTIAAGREFVNHLRFQQGNVTLPGEQDLTDSLTNQWNTYRVWLERFFTLSAEGTDRRQFYRNSRPPQLTRVGHCAANHRHKPQQHGFHRRAGTQGGGGNQPHPVAPCALRHPALGALRWNILAIHGEAYFQAYGFRTGDPTRKPRLLSSM